MSRVSFKRAVGRVGVPGVVALSFLAVPTASAAGVSITVDGAQTFQTISGLGADINPHS
jgi:hypothetical protein